MTQLLWVGDREPPRVWKVGKETDSQPQWYSRGEMHILSLISRMGSTEWHHWIQIRIHAMNRQALQVISQEKVPCPRPGLEKRNTVGAFILLLAFGSKLVFAVISDLWKSCKGIIENLYAPYPDFTNVKISHNDDTLVKTKHHICVLLSTEFQTWFRFPQIFFQMLSLYVPHSHVLHLIIMPPFSLPTHDCV